MSVLYLNICMDKEELFLLHSLGWGYPDVHDPRRRVTHQPGIFLIQPPAAVRSLHSLC